MEGLQTIQEIDEEIIKGMAAQKDLLGVKCMVLSSKN